MKWNRFIVTEQAGKRSSPVSHLDSSRRSSHSRNKHFGLKSCYKIDQTPTRSVILPSKVNHDQENFNDLAIRNMVSRISLGQPSQPDDNKTPQYEPSQKGSPLTRAQELQNLASSFFKQLQNLLQTFFKQHEHLQLNHSEGEALKKDITDNFQTHIAAFFADQQKSLQKALPSAKKVPSGFEQNSAERKANRVIQFKNQKITQKQGAVESEASALEGKLRKILTRTEKFERSSRSNSRLRHSKRERSLDSSADIIEKSFNDSYRSSKSRLKAKEAFYHFSKVLNQNNS